MSNTPTTLQILINKVRNRTNMESSQFVTDAEITDYINEDLSELDDQLVETYSDWKLTNTTATISNPATNYFAVPTDCYKVRGVDRQVDGDPQHFQTVKQFGFQERNQNNYPAYRIYSYMTHLKWMRQGNNVVIIPADNSLATYKLWYTPQYINLVNTTDTLQPYMDIQNWHQFAIVGAAVKVLQKQRLDPSDFMMQKDKLAERITKAAASNVKGDIRRVVNTRYMDETSWDSGIFGT